MNEPETNPRKRGLPPGCTIDDLLNFPSEAAQWLGESEDWCRRRQAVLPGVIILSRKAVKFHPRTFLEVKTRKWKPAK